MTRQHRPAATDFQVGRRRATATPDLVSLLAASSSRFPRPRAVRAPSRPARSDPSLREASGGRGGGEAPHEVAAIDELLRWGWKPAAPPAIAGPMAKKPAWLSILPGNLDPPRFTLDQLRDVKAVHAFLTEKIEGPPGFAE